jgi:hypothetical protein
MPSQNIVLTGKIMWAKGLYVPQRFEDGPLMYTFPFYPDDGSLAIFEEMKKKYKLRNNIRSDDKGKFMVLRRPHDAREYEGKVIFEGGAPKVLNADGSPFDPDVIIGNGSKVSVLLEVYGTERTGGSRVEKVKVLELVPYEGPANTEATPF